MARTKISPPAPPRPTKAPHRTSVLNISRSVREQPTKAVTRGYWANLAHTLGGSLNDEYLSAMETLASLFALPSSEFVAISSKITALIELMHNALKHRGVQAYEFSYCPPALIPYKVAYFRLLHLLRDMRHRIDDTLQERVQRLLLPLSPSFQVHTGEGPSRGSGTSNPPPRGSLKDHAPSASGRLREHRVPMPPPPVNWRDAHIQATSRNPSALRRVTHLWTRDEGLRALAHLTKRTHNGDADPRPVKRRRTSSSGSHHKTSGYRVVSSPSPDEDQENATPNSHRRAEDGRANFTAAEDDGDDSSLSRVTIIRPNPLRRFGIFCTGKSSMHGPNPWAWRHSRPIAVRQCVE